ncbi:glutamine amidotransferase subunit pdxT [Viridothelium virens]|uniref:glutaminase n=1 Tax=Viridothelium virens TaxID=1048519 RepID=A0A6A6GSS4_VIRVR|nr:glutamine amidotransferase subunit pdxT [Viridothelium virens]
MTEQSRLVTVGVLALQGAFSEHLQLLRLAGVSLPIDDSDKITWSFTEVRTEEELSQCDALIIPGGESTTMSLVAERSGLLEPLRDFVKASRKPTWGTCAGLILLAESANRTKRGGQELVGGLDVRVNRNHFGRQVESFEADLDLPFLETLNDSSITREHVKPFHSVFIRAPVVEKILQPQQGIQDEEASVPETIIAPSKVAKINIHDSSIEKGVEVMARLPGEAVALSNKDITARATGDEGNIVAVRQGNVFATSFHPELTGDARIHTWWLDQVLKAIERS